MSSSSYNYFFSTNLIKNFFELVYVIISMEIDITIKLTKYLTVTDSLFIRSISFIFVIKFRHDTFFRQILNKISNPITFNTELNDI